MKIGNGPVTTKKAPYNRGFGLFGLSRVAHLSIVSRSPLTGLFKEKRLSFDGKSTLGDAIPLEDEETTRVVATELFGNCPVRQRFLATAFASQHRSIVQLLTRIAASHHTVHFIFSIDDDPPISLSPQEQFDRLHLLFADAFSPRFDWLSIDFNSADMYMHGFVISPNSFHSVASRSNPARLLFCRERDISSPELVSSIDSIWRSFFVSKIEDKRLKHYPIFFLDIGGPHEQFELFRGVDASTSLLLHHNKMSAVTKNLRTYLHQIMFQSRPNLALTRSEDNSSGIFLSDASLEFQPPQSSSNEPQSESIMSTSEIWDSIMRKPAFQHRRVPDILPCRVPRLSVPQQCTLQDLKVIGQVDSKFIVGVTREGVLCAFDQHAVHERLRFEYLLRLLHSQSPSALGSYELYPPVSIALSFSQWTNIQYLDQELRRWNWQFDLEFDSGGSSTSPTLTITHVPVISTRRMNPEQILIHTAELASNKGASLTPSIFLSAIKSKACRGAVMFGDTLSLTEMESMVHGLASCTQPFACAHGRTNIALLTDV